MALTKDDSTSVVKNPKSPATILLQVSSCSDKFFLYDFLFPKYPYFELSFLTAINFVLVVNLDVAAFVVALNISYDTFRFFSLQNYRK